jgi:histidine triad (HIT) family protein
MPPDPSPGVTAIPLPHPSDADVWRATRFRQRGAGGAAVLRRRPVGLAVSGTFLGPAVDFTRMSDCVFCSIVDGEIPSYTVYEDDDVMAFLDANPLSRGHTLVIPKAHHERINDLPADLSTAVFDAVHDLTPRIEAAVDAEATTVAVNNGTAAGQEVPHVHVHVVPRSESDGGRPIHALIEHPPDVGDGELDDVAASIRSD